MNKGLLSLPVYDQIKGKQRFLSENCRLHVDEVNIKIAFLLGWIQALKLFHIWLP